MLSLSQALRRFRQSYLHADRGGRARVSRGNLSRTRSLPQLAKRYRLLGAFGRRTELVARRTEYGS
jgi:hypothetical protein